MRWELTSAMELTLGGNENPEVEQLLRDGWEPFATCSDGKHGGIVLHFRRKQGRR